MTFLLWDESMSVGVAEFDAHHRKLVDLVNTLFDAMKTGKGKEVMGKVLEELVAYSRYHFEAEEKLMRNYEYPAYITHRGEHEHLVEEVLALSQKFQAGDIFLSLDILNFLKEWLSKHILQSDMAYKEFFKQKGIR
ncbi:MAG: bacteriohemerythrin [Brevinematales bacterium]|nr:bacteriohemerythrin [Brevinematales bacterium]